jgi:hypothetical protein
MEDAVADTTSNTKSITSTGALALRIGSRRVVIGVATLADASRMFLRLNCKAMQRGSILRHATVHDSATMETVARISQNGNVWPNADWFSGMRPLYTPTDADFAACHQDLF